MFCRDAPRKLQFSTREQEIAVLGTGLLGPIGSKIHVFINTLVYGTRRRRDVGTFPKRLHLGCGTRRAPGFCNVDVTPMPSVDIIDDVARLERFPADYAESIYACHVLEHFSHAEAVAVLRRWYRVLKPGGEIRISVPDIDRIVQIYVRNWDHFQTDGNAPWTGLIYGGQTDVYDFHKTGFNFCWLRHLMTEIGYEGVAEYPHVPHFIPDFVDASLAREPFGEFISLNVRALKPK
jgi:predicted SAM-dependent methyltransferase